MTEETSIYEEPTTPVVSETEEVSLEPTVRRRISPIRVLGLGILSGFIFFILWFVWALQPAASEPVDVLVTPGESVAQVVAKVAAAGAVRSESVLYILTQYYYADETVETGTYSFQPNMNVFAVAEHLMLTTPADELVAVTFPEGISVVEMAAIAAEKLNEVTSEAFLAQTENLEGELLPETYFVPVDYTTDELVTLLQQSQKDVLAEYVDELAASGFSTYEILTLASILEREANDETSMRMVAGILRNRLAADMPLQADATIEYVLDTPLNELPPGALAENLRGIDSPYNTYLYRGLPPTPIGNPGALAISAAIAPTESVYYFYLTGSDGEFYYAETYDEHLINIERYLR